MKKAIKKEQKTEGRVLARVISEEALKNVGGARANGYWTSVITEGGCDITNVGGDDDGYVE
ncbi:MAG: hypothetical protein QOH06_5166 [Acidobacteriota bacterium]|jgi:hypothetical protein|nr:hypothetical protein [Acidobacteriota bacterium]